MANSGLAGGMRTRLSSHATPCSFRADVTLPHTSRRYFSAVEEEPRISLHTFFVPRAPRTLSRITCSASPPVSYLHCRQHAGCAKYALAASPPPRQVLQVRSHDHEKRLLAAQHTWLPLSIRRGRCRWDLASVLREKCSERRFLQQTGRIVVLREFWNRPAPPGVMNEYFEVHA